MSKITELEDILGQVSSFAQAIFLAANGLGHDDVDAFQVMADEILKRSKEARSLIDGLGESAKEVLAAVDAEKARRAAARGGSLMTKATAELIDNTYDAIELMSLLAQRLADGEIHMREASSMSWLLGRAKERLEPVIVALEEIESRSDQECVIGADADLIELGSELVALHEKFSRRRRGEPA